MMFVYLNLKCKRLVFIGVIISLVMALLPEANCSNVNDEELRLLNGSVKLHYPQLGVGYRENPRPLLIASGAGAVLGSAFEVNSEVAVFSASVFRFLQIYDPSGSMQFGQTELALLIFTGSTTLLQRIPQIYRLFSRELLSFLNRHRGENEGHIKKKCLRGYPRIERLDETEVQNHPVVVVTTDYLSPSLLTLGSSAMYLRLFLHDEIRSGYPVFAAIFSFGALSQLHDIYPIAQINFRRLRYSHHIWKFFPEEYMFKAGMLLKKLELIRARLQTMSQQGLEQFRDPFERHEGGDLANQNRVRGPWVAIDAQELDLFDAPTNWERFCTEIERAVMGCSIVFNPWAIAGSLSTWVGDVAGGIFGTILGGGLSYSRYGVVEDLMKDAGSGFSVSNKKSCRCCRVPIDVFSLIRGGWQSLTFPALVYALAPDLYTWQIVAISLLPSIQTLGVNYSGFKVPYEDYIDMVENTCLTQSMARKRDELVSRVTHLMSQLREGALTVATVRHMFGQLANGTFTQRVFDDLGHYNAVIARDLPAIFELNDE